MNRRHGHAGTSRWSLCSRDSLLSIASTGSVLSVGSVGSALSIGSIGSAASIFSIGSAASVGSALSSASAFAVLAHRALPGDRGDETAAGWSGVGPAAILAVGAAGVLAQALWRRRR
jgi:hypothetical protein